MSAPIPTQVPAAEPLSPAEVARARKDFPYLARPARNGQELAYLDWAATAQKPQCVLDAEFRFYRMSNGAAGRSTYQLADEATASLEDAREAVAAFVGARASQLVFTKNATEAINLVALAIGHASLGRPAAGGPGAAPASDPARRLALGPGDEVVVTRAEHHANLVPWQELCARTGATLRWLDLDGAGRIDLAGLDVLTARTRVLALGHASNVTGAIAPLAPVLDAARAAGSAAGREPIVVLDTCQTAPHMPLDFTALAAAGVDAIALSSHKMCGPTGVGALVATEELLDAMPPVLTGGSMIEVVTMESSTYMPPPARFEAGSQPLAQAAGWRAAVDYLGILGMDRLRAREEGLTAHALDGMRRVPGLRIIGPDSAADRLGVIAFTIEGVHPHDVGQVLDAAGVAVRTGHHCAQPIHAHFGIHASSRVSFGPTTTIEEIDRFLEAAAGVQSYFRR
ncbi:aminotransferase class V-fold PLP-dependent enzyme [Actinomyces timonensis]|uniref:aminotransferase class V-fold PLP-dependent enzyme n=1 Tax=Actinomyces timonensis TaxID=1288391 RepID=UPI0003173030|nr:aminotransferase class V-fold PLP-dependent enzyme [Actinomyces timonensis]